MAKKETRYTVGSEIETFNTVVSEPVAPSLQARELPGQSGVYLMKDKDDRIIYVGKAKDLRKRVTSYFLANRNCVNSCCSMYAGPRFSHFPAGLPIRAGTFSVNRSPNGSDIRFIMFEKQE